MSDTRSLVTRHLQEFVTVGDEKLLQTGRQLAAADRARETQQRKLQAGYRQLATAAATSGTREADATRRATAAATQKAGALGRLTVAEERLQRRVLEVARAQINEDRALKAAARSAAQYTTAKHRQAEALTRTTAAANASSAALNRNARAGVAAATRGSVASEARSVGSRGIGLATGVAGAAGAAGIFGIAGLAREAVDYERQMSQVQAVAGATRREMEQLDALALELGAKTAYSASDSALALGELGKAGFTAREQLATLPGTIDLAAASGTELADAATIQSDALRGFGLDVGQATHVADIFAVAVNKSAIEMSDLGYTLKYMAPIAATTGQSIEDMSAAVAILGNVGIRGDTAGTTLRRVMTSIVKPTKASVAALDELGLAAEDLQGPDGLKPLPDIIAKLVEQAAKLPKADRLRVMTTIFGRESISGTMALLDHGAPKLRKLSAEMRNADGAADAMARTMQDNVYYQVEQVQGAVESLALTIFKEFAPGLQRAATDAAGSIESWTASEENIERVTGAINDFAGTIGDLVAAGMPLVDLAASLAGAWQSLPDPVRLSVLQFAALAVVTRKLAGSAAVGGLISTLARLRGGLKATATEAAATRSTLGTLASAPTSVAPVVPSAVARTAQDAASNSAVVSTRQGAIATRLRVEARDAVAAHERDLRRMAAMPAVIQRTEQQAARVRVAAGMGHASTERVQAASAAASAARQELQTLRASTIASGRHAAERQAAAAAATSEATATARTTSLLRSQAGHHAKVDGIAAPAASRIAGGREGRPLGAIGTWQMTRGLGGTRREALAESARRTASRVPTPTGRGAAGAVAAGGIGSVIGGGDIASAAISGGAMGMVAGPWGAAGGAAAGAGITALVNEFKRASTKRAEAAATEFAERVTANTRAAVDAGIRKPSARRLGEATTVVNAANEIREMERRARELRERAPLMGPGRSIPQEEHQARKLIDQAKDRAKTAGLDYNAVIRKDSNAERAAGRTVGREALSGFKADAKQYRWFDEKQLAIDAKKQLAVLPASAREAAARSMAEWARQIEKDGRLPKGATGRLVMELGRTPGELQQKWEHATRAAVQAIDSQLEDRRVVRSAKRLMDELGQLSPSLDIQLDTKTLPGSVAKMRTQLDTLRKMAADKSLPKEMREDAAKQLPGLKKAYDDTLGRMAWRMGMSEEEAGKWARSVSRAARRAGGTAEQVKVLKDRVKDLTDELGTSQDPVKKLEAAFRDLGMSAADAKKRVDEVTKPPKKADGALINPTKVDLPEIPGARRGGPIMAYAHGGPIIDTMMSGGEEYLPPDVAARYPAGVLDQIAAAQRPHFVRGGPVGRPYNLGGVIVPGPSDRDGTYVPAEDGGFVLTGHGRQLRDQMLGFNKGGATGKKNKPKKVRAARIGYTVFDDPPPGAWGSLDGGYAELGTATRGGVATKRGHLAKALGMAGELPVNTPLTIVINGKRGTSKKRDRGYGQGGNGTTSDDKYGLDLWKSEWKKYGIGGSSKGMATIALGAGVTADQLAASGTRSTTTTTTTDDVKGMSARDARRQRAILRRPNVDVSGVFDESRDRAYDAYARAQTLSQVITAGRVNLEKRTKTTSGRAGKSGSAGSGGSLPSRSQVVDAARKLRSPNLDGANPGMGVYGRLGKYFDLKISDGLRPGGVTSSGNRSQHADGNALDQSGSAANMLRYARWLSSSGIAKGMDQLIHTPLGFGWNKGSKVPLSFFGSKVNKDHHDHVHSGDATPPKFRRGGPIRIRRMATGGRVGTTSRIIRDTRGAVDGKPARAALGSLYSAGIREQRQVTDALEELQRLLGDTRRVTVEQLAALNAALVRGIGRTRAKSSPGGASITRAEEAQNRRSRSALSLVHESLLGRAGRVAARGDRLGGAIEDQRGMVDRSMRRANLSPDSAVGLQRQGRQISWEQAQRGVQLGQLERARDIAKRAGASGREKVKGLDAEIKALSNDIADLAVQRIENARAQVSKAAADRTASAQFGVDFSAASMAELDATQRVTRTSGTAGGMQQRAAALDAQLPGLQQLHDAQVGQMNTAASLHGTESEEFRSAFLAAKSTAAQFATTMADAADTWREAAMKAVQSQVDSTAHGTSMSNLGLQGLELTQRLSKTYEGGGAERAAYIRSSVIPALEAEKAALEAKKAESERQEANLADKPLTAADMEAIAGKQNEILSASLAAQEAIESNTSPKRVGGSLGFGYRGDQMTDILIDGVGT